jgi:ABC-2 type transport system permease protein
VSGSDGGFHEGLLPRLRRVGELVRKELLQLRRNPALARLLLVAPVIQLVVFGYAVSTDVRDTPAFVVDQDASVESRALLDAFTASGHFRIAGRSRRAADAVAELDHGRATVALVVPAGFAADAAAGRGRVQLLVDGTNSNTAGIARGYAMRILAGHAAQLGTPVTPAVEVRQRAWYNQELASRNYNVPGVIAMLVLLTSMLVTSLAVVREREIGTLEQLLVSPVRPIELVLGKALPFALVGLVDLVLVTAVAILWFRVPFTGSFALLALEALVYLIPSLGLGLLISTISRTQQEAFLSSFLVLMPTMLLSGFMFPVSSMPRAFQWIAQAIPMTHFLVIVRGIFLKGAGLELLWGRTLVLLAMGVLLFGAAVWRFRPRAG